MSLPFMPPEIRTHQVGGSHYAGKRIQPWDIILDHGLDYWEGNALKYLLRRKGNRLEDLRKARHYLDECIRQEEWRARRRDRSRRQPRRLSSGSNAAGPSGLPPG
jgi:hypothetical protein